MEYPNCERWKVKPTAQLNSKVIEAHQEFRENYDTVLDCEDCVYTCGWDGICPCCAHN
jgi:hypothetical protein